ncbi:MAG: hypothetical protein A2W91_01265 [Bacteroidetes bacterium GWF2_38_335]|nr:MAG: hypothetical protein A2W91_01265 [Bacteroidetes bacterium GWF2_38_335]OFY80970.1 MAG: hypothetical protein A2281_13000 [Bacteroidetes bacterium RIFOXYA12_FULL_38_20]HBS85092.1 hypothetical protein [Bacteroidales bacterium]
MKKYLFLAILFVFIVKVNYSQVSFSLDAAPQLSWMKSDKSVVESDGAKFGFKFGLNLDFFFNEGKNYAFCTGIKINNMAGALKYNIADTLLLFYHDGALDSLPVGSVIDYKLQYLEIPLGLKFKTNEIGYITYFAQIGISPLINIGASGNGSHADMSFDKHKINEEVRLFGMGYHIGAGMEYSLGGETSFLAGFTYTNGFMDVTSNDQIKDKTILNSVSLNVGIKF